MHKANGKKTQNNRLKWKICNRFIIWILPILNYTTIQTESINKSYAIQKHDNYKRNDLNILLLKL